MSPDQVRDEHVELINSTSAPMVSAIITPEAKSRVDGIPVMMGRLGESHISVLRDTGSNTVIVCRALVAERDMTEPSSSIYLVDMEQSGCFQRPRLMLRHHSTVGSSWPNVWGPLSMI